ncbi:glycosyltransferase family 2 protein [Patescibacteria group bacterium]|nr:glycosyltransferase family 2 protein [Patescibacteria group bacterium]
MRKISGFILSLLLFSIGKERKEKPSSTYKPSVTVLIPAFNEEAVITATIRSVQAQTYPVEEIIVVDDCSLDRTAQIAASLVTKVVRTHCNTGTKSRALNFGTSFVHTEVVVNVDADTVLDPKAIEYLIPALSDGKTLCASGFVIPQRIKNFWEMARLVQYLYYLRIHKSAQVHWQSSLVASGCFSALNTAILKELGGFPEGNMAEDMALTWKAHLVGKKVKFVPQAVCYPKDPSNWKQYRSQVTRWYRGFLQCIADNRTHLAKKPRLAFFVLWYLLSGISQPLFLGAFAYMLVSRLWLKGELALVLSGAITFEICVVFATAFFWRHSVQAA